MGSRPTRREQDVLEVLYRRGEASAEDIRRVLDISNSAARTLLSRLAEKGRVERSEEGRRYMYRPIPRAVPAGRQSAERLIETFFPRQPGEAVLAVMDAARDRMSDEEWDELLGELRGARDEARGGES